LPRAPQVRIGGERGSVDRKWFSELLRSQGFNSQKAFAAAIGLDGPKLTNLLAGKRRPQISELTEMSQALNVPVVTLLGCLGLGLLKMLPTELVVNAAVREDDRVEFYDPSLPVSIGFPVPDYPGVGVQIATSTLMPRYLEGEILGAQLGETRHVDLKTLIGEEAFIEVANAGFFLKRLQPGSRRGRYTLASLNTRIPPMLDAEVVRGVPIDFHVPKSVQSK
jgi:transcriptional regulator with XRE-family HTH domain